MLLKLAEALNDVKGMKDSLEEIRVSLSTSRHWKRKRKS